MGTKKLPGSYRRKNKGWELRVTAGPDPARPGKYLRVTKTIGAVSEKQAGRELAKFYAEVQADVQKRHQGTFGELIEEWYASLSVEGKKQSTLDGYRSYIDNWLSKTTVQLGQKQVALLDVPVRKLTTPHFDTLYRRMMEAGRKPSSINQAHAICRSACNYGINRDWLAKNPTRGTARPSVWQQDIVPPTPAELRRIIVAAASEDPALAVMFIVAAGLGCRRGELCALRWRNVDWSVGSVRIKESVMQLSMKRHGRLWAMSDVKTHQAATSSLPPEAVEVLTWFRVVMEARAANEGKTIAEDGFIFSSHVECREPLVPNNITSAFNRAREKAGAPNARLHDLRHLKGSMMAATGADVATIAAELRHSTPVTTLRFYLHSMPEARQQAVNRYGSGLDLSMPTTEPAAIEVRESTRPDACDG